MAQNLAPDNLPPSGSLPEFLRRGPAAAPRLEPTPAALGRLTRNRAVWGSCAAVAFALVVALPVAQGLSAVSPNPLPTQQVNRAAKGDLLAAPRDVARRVPVQPVKNPARPVREQSDKRSIMDGCESSFSPVTVPSMAHIAGRCVG